MTSLNSLPKGEIKVEDELKQQIELIGKNNSKINWIVSEFKFVSKVPTLVPLATGNGGLNECLECLKENEKLIMAGVIKVLLVDTDDSTYDKFIYFRMVSCHVKPMAKAKVTTYIDKINDTFPVKHLSRQLDEDFKTHLNMKALAKDLSHRLENIMEVKKYCFGPSQDYEIPQQTKNKE